MIENSEKDFVALIDKLIEKFEKYHIKHESDMDIVGIAFDDGALHALRQLKSLSTAK